MTYDSILPATVRHPRTRRTAVALGTTALLLLTGCAADPEATDVATVTPTETATEEATSEESAPEATTPEVRPEPAPADLAAPEAPANLAQDGVVGAIAAAEHYLALYSYAARTGDVAGLTAATGLDNDFGAEAIATITDAWATGRMNGAELTQDGRGLLEVIDTAAGTFTIKVAATIGGLETLDADGATVTYVPERTGDFLVTVTGGANAWTATAVEPPA